MNEEFYNKNKSVLLEEIGSSISDSNSILNDIINLNSEDGMTDQKLLIALGHKIGYMSALYNQYFVLINGLPQEKEENKIGFLRMLKKDI